METMQKTYPGGVCSRLNPNEAVTSTNEYIYMHVYTYVSNCNLHSGIIRL